jgi:hypothetical protein
MSRHVAARLTLALCGLLALAACLPRPPRAAAQAPAGTIAYVRADSLDEIRLIEPDGGGDRQLWAHGRPDPNAVYAIGSLAWRHDGTELAFSSTHEFDCSLNESDIFVAAVGAAARRVTQAPGCAALAGLPHGRVVVPVRNVGFDAVTGFLYYQGAPGVQAVTLPPGGSATVTFEQVADFGDEIQAPVLILPLDGVRQIGFGAAADVKAGQTVTTGEFPISGSGNPQWGAAWPAWSSDGAALSFVFAFSSIYQIDPRPAPLEFGTRLLPEEAVTDFADLLAWGPAPARAGQLLYAGNTAFDREGVYLATASSVEPGEPLVAYEVYENIRGLAWLPDGSGFVYSVTEMNEMIEPASANLFLYSFATGRAQRLTSFADTFAGQLSVSPDGQQIVFERSPAHDGSGPTDLWLVGRDGAGLRLLAENAARPAWSSQAPRQEPQPTPGPTQPTPQPGRELVYLPLLRR